MSNLLKERRSELGKELREIAEVTRIKGAYLRFIEEDEFEKLPVEVYTRGYIKEYAEFLGIPSDVALGPYEQYLGEKKGGKEKVMLHEKEATVLTREIIEGLDTFKGRVDPRDVDILLSPEMKFSSHQKTFPLKMLWVLPAVAIAVGIYFIMPAMKIVPRSSPGRNVQTMQVPQTVPPVVYQNPQAPSVLPELPDSNAVVKGPQVPESSKPQQKPPIPKDITKETKDTALTAQVKPQSQGEKSPSAKKKHTLRINATGRVWIRVVIDGKDNKQIILNQGDTVSYGADESVALTVGNAAGATVLYDGKSFENLGNVGQVVKLVFPSSGPASVSPATSHQSVPSQPSEPLSPKEVPEKPE